MKKTLFLLIFALPFSLLAQFDMANHVSQNTYLSREQFLENFPYNDYLKVIGFTEFATLRGHRDYLNTNREQIGDDFLYYLGDNFLKLYPIGTSLKQLNAKIDIGEMFLSKKTAPTSADREVFQLMGYFLLGKVAQKIEGEFKAGRFDINQPENEKVITRLASNKVYLSIEKSDWDKAMQALEKGNFGYLWDRFSKKLDEWSGAGTTKSTLTLGNYPAKTHKNVEIYKILDAQKTNIGNCIWLNASQGAKMTYFASGKAYTRYSEFASKKGKSNIILATTGGFTNAEKQPEGLTIDNGRVVNAVLKPERHGIVIVEKSGNVRVENLRNGISLPNYGQKLYPLSTLRDFSILLSWFKNNGATVFQTQLLAYNNQPLIELSKAPNQLRERRLLAVVNDGGSTRHYVVVSVTANRNLAVVTEEVMDMMRKRGKNIEAVLNFDVGSYNILRVMDKTGKEISGLRGPIEIYKATNLVVFYQ